MKASHWIRNARPTARAKTGMPVEAVAPPWLPAAATPAADEHDDGDCDQRVAVRPLHGAVCLRCAESASRPAREAARSHSVDAHDPILGIGVRQRHVERCPAPRRPIISL